MHTTQTRVITRMSKITPETPWMTICVVSDRKRGEPLPNSRGGFIVTRKQ